MEERSEYGISVDCLRRLTQQDNSDKFNLIIKYQPDKVIKEYSIQTTLNKSRAISNKINEIYQIDPTISQYELNIPKLFLSSSQKGEDEKFQSSYIRDHLTDDIANNEYGQIVKQFLNRLSQIKDVIKVQYQNDELNGIISHLKAKYDEKLCENGEIKITDIGNLHEVNGSLANLIKYDNDEFYVNNWGSNPMPNENEGWIEFDFVKRKINLSSYTPRNSKYITSSNYPPKSWRIVGSNDRENWDVLNQQVNNSVFNNSNCKQHRFECDTDNKYYQYIRYIQDDTWQDNRKHNIFMTCIEFFGSISEQ